MIIASHMVLTALERAHAANEMSCRMHFIYILCPKYKQLLSVQPVKFLLCGWFLRFGLTSTSDWLGWGAPQSEDLLWFPPCGLDEKVHQDPKRAKGGSDRPDSRSRSFHAPAPSTHPIHSYLKAVTHWLQNGIDYWFPSHLRSAVIAAVSGLAERQPVERREAPAGNTQAQMHVHTFH